MRIISTILSVLIAILSIIVPSSLNPTANEFEETQNQVDYIFDTFLQDRLGALDEETYTVLMSILKEVLAEAFNNQGNLEEVKKLIEQIPIYETSERMDAERADVTVNVFDKAFREVFAKSLEYSLLPESAKHIMTMVARGVYGMYIYLVPVEGQKNVYVFYADYVNSKGEVVIVFSGVIYDKNTGELYGIKDNVMLGIGFNYNVEEFIVTTPVHTWQRNFGYNVFYDVLGNMGFMKTETIRVMFEHGGKHWMFQMWKGSYTFNLANGAEIGMYNKDNKYSMFYDCAKDEEMLDMSLRVNHGDKVLVNIEETRHWWVCGFDMGNPIPPEELTMYGTIKFEDKEMMNKFVESAKEFENEMTVTADGMKVKIEWK